MKFFFLINGGFGEGQIYFDFLIFFPFLFCFLI